MSSTAIETESRIHRSSSGERADGKAHLVVLPAYNEEASLEATINRAQLLPDDFELLVVNDGSRDKTGEIAERLAKQRGLPLHVVNLPINCGRGAAMQTGYRFAQQSGRYHYVIQFDADGQHDASCIVSLVEECDQRLLDLCIGSRFLNQPKQQFLSTRLRRLGIRFLSFLLSTTTRMRITDPTSGFRCSGPRAWQIFATLYADDHPEPESILWCVRHRLRVGELPVIMYERQGGISSIRRLGSLYYMAKVILSILVETLRSKESKADVC